MSSDFGDWDPMADDFHQTTPSTFDRTLFSEEKENNVLFIKGVPKHISKDAFTKLISTGNRNITSLSLNTKSSHPQFGYAFVHFATPADAKSALNALHEKPPLNLFVTFAMKKQNPDYDQNGSHSTRTAEKGTDRTGVNLMHDSHMNTNHFSSRGRGRGLSSLQGSKPAESHSNASHIADKGRGMRIDLDGVKSISHSIKVTSSQSGRKITVVSPEKTLVPHSVEVARVKNSSRIFNEEDKKVQPSNSSNFKGNKARQNVPKLVVNPFSACFVCGKHGPLSCGICNKPYCSAACQVSDWASHQFICEIAKGVCQSVLKSFNSSNTPANDSCYMSAESSSSESEKLCEMQSDPVRTVSRRNVKSPMSLANKNTDVSVSPNSMQNSSRKPLLPTPEKLDMENNERGDIENVVLKPGQTEKVSIVHIESLSKFWISLEKYSSTFLKMEKDLQSIQRKKISSTVKNSFCAVVNENKVCRCKILQANSQESTVYLVDYGQTITVSTSSLFVLPSQFRSSNPCMAVCCRLAENDVQWSSEDLLSFKLHASMKQYRAVVSGCSAEIYDVSLVNEDGISLYAILNEEKNSSCNDYLSSDATISFPPSIFSKLKCGDSLRIVPVIEEDESLFCYLFTDDTQCSEIAKVEELLRSYAAEEISLYAEEGDFAVGFSQQYQQYYRCMVLQRKPKSFVVRYIDFGNKEEITKLLSLKPEILQTCSYVVGFDKRNNASVSDLQNLFAEEFNFTVSNIKPDSAELRCSSGKSVFCHPCFHTGQHESEPRVINQEKAITSPSVTVNHVASKVSDRNSMPAKTLAPNSTHNIKIVCVKTFTEVFVHLMEDEEKVTKFYVSLNEYCRSKAHSKYLPKVDEIVCCKFSDGCWYRGKVVKQNNDRFLVSFIDYGNIDEVSDADIIFLPDKFICPSFAVSVSLHGIKQEDISEYILHKLLNEPWEMKTLDTSKSPADVTLSQNGCSLNEIVTSAKNSKSNLNFQMLPLDGCVQVKVCSQDEKLIYVQQLKDLDEIQKLSQNLQKLSGAAIPKVLLRNVIYCGLFEGSWYRVCVKEVSSSSCAVYLVDFGKQVNVLVNDFRDLPPELFSLPVYCTPIKLDSNQENVELNIGSQYSLQVLNTKNKVQIVRLVDVPKIVKISSLKKQCLKEGMNEVQFCFAGKNKRFCHLISDDKDILNLFKMLQGCAKKEVAGVENGDVVCAKSSDGFWHRASVINNRSAPMYKVCFFDYGNTESVAKDCIKHLPDNLLTFPIYALPVKIMNETDHDSFIGSVQIKKIKLLEDNVCGVEIVRSLKVSSLRKLALPQETFTEVAPSHFDEYLYVQPVLHLKELATLSNSLFQADAFEKLSILPEVGDVVCAKYSEDGLWYRASVEEKCSNEVKVQFIDYGNSSTQALESLRNLPSKLSEYPVFCIPVKIKDQSKLLGIGETFKVKVVEMDGNLPVVDILSANDQSSNSACDDSVAAATKSVATLKVSAFHKLSLPLNSFAEVALSHLDELFLYVQPVAQLTELTSLINLLLQADKFEKLSSLPTVGDVVCAKFTADGLWYRASVEKISSNEVTVNFLDYGNSATETLENLRILPCELSGYPMFCIPVKVKDWSKLQGIGETFNVKVVEMDDNLPVVDILLPNEQSCDNPVAATTKSVPTHKISAFNKLSLSLDSFTEVTLSHLDDLYLYVQPVSQLSELASLSNMLLEADKFEKLTSPPEISDVLCVRFADDGVWYRASVEKISGKEIMVNFLDYGNSTTVTLENLRTLPSELSTYPVFCIPIKIKDRSKLVSETFAVKVVEMDGDVPVIEILSPSCKDEPVAVQNEKIPERQQFLFSSLSQRELPVGESRLVLFCYKENKTLYLQDLVDVPAILEMQENLSKICKTDGPPLMPSVGEVVAAMSSADNCWYRACVKEILPSNEFRVCFIDYGNFEVIPEKNFHPIPSDLCKYPTFCIRVEFKDGTVADSIILGKEYTVVASTKCCDGVQMVKIHPSASTGLSEVSTSAESKNESLCTNQVLTFSYDECEFVPFTSGEQDIVIYSIFDCQNVFCAPFSIENITANAELSRVITEHCVENGKPFNDDSELKVGDMVLAKFSEDGQWYRAVILDKCLPKYIVSFLDYGNTEHVTLSNLRKMEKKFMELKIQAHMASLSGFTIKEEKVNEVNAELQQFSILYTAEPLRALVKVGEEEIVINVPRITNHLVEKKLATPS